MSIYGNNIFANESTSLVIKSEPITESEALAIALEAMILIESDDDEDEDDSLQEGANIDSFKAYRAAMKEYKSIMKDSRKAYKKKDYNAAKKCANDALKVLDNAKKEIKSFESTAGSVVWGVVIEAFQIAAAATIPILGGFAGLHIGAGISDLVYNTTKYESKIITKEVKSSLAPFYKVFAAISAIFQLLGDLLKLKEQAEKNAKGSKADKANFFKANILSGIDRLASSVKMYIDNINSKME